MKYIISYTDDKPGLIDWLLQNRSSFPDKIILDDNGDPKLNINKVPVHENNDCTVTNIIVDTYEESIINDAPLEILSYSETSSIDAYSSLDQDGWDKIAMCINQEIIDITDPETGDKVGEYTAPLCFGVIV